MKKENLFIKIYNNENSINVKENLDIFDECFFSYLDILKENEVDSICKVEQNCRCVESGNFNTYYNKCDVCNGVGKINLNGNEVVCNHCHGQKVVIKNICPLCKGEGKLLKKGHVLVKLNKELKEGDILTIKEKGKERNGIRGDLHIKIKIVDLDRFKINGNDVYDRKIISFSKEEISKNISKTIETIKGYVKVQSSGEVLNEVVKLEGQGIKEGDFYICLNNELVEVRGKDVYKNVVINKDMLGFYLSKEEMAGERNFLNVYYFKKVDDKSPYEYIELEDVNNFKIVKLKEKGLSGKHGGVNGDLYLRIYFDDTFKVIDDKIYSFPLKLAKYELNEGKKILEFGKSKIVLNFEKNLNMEKEVLVKDYGKMINKNNFDSIIFNVNPFDYNVYKVSVKVSKKDKVVYLKDYKKYFYEEVKQFNEGLKVTLNKKKENIVRDSEGNKVIIRVIE